MNAALAVSHHVHNRELAAAFDTWMLAQGFSAHTRRAYRRAVDEFTESLEGASLLEVDKVNVRVFLAKLYKRGCGPKTMARELAVLRTLFDCLVLAKKMPANPARRVVTRRLPVRLPKRIPTEHEVARLIAAAESTRDRAVLELLYATGVRVSELLQIRVEDIDFAERATLIRHGKGDKQRIVLFGQPAAEALARHLDGRKTGYLFANHRAPQYRVRKARPNKDIPTLYWRGCWWEPTRAGGWTRPRWKWFGKVSELSEAEAQRELDKLLAPGAVSVEPGSRPVEVRTIRNIIRAAASRAGVGKLSPHSLRHAFATHLLARGADIRSVQTLLGHEKLSTTALYLSVTQPDLARTLERCHPREVNHDKESRS